MWIHDRSPGSFLASCSPSRSKAHPLLCLCPYQCKLFNSIKPLFANKPTLLVINKIDIVRLSDLTPANRALVEEIISQGDVTCVQASCYSEEGVIDVRDAACDALLAHRVEAKLKGSRINSVANKIHVSQPKPRDELERKPHIPDSVRERKKYDKDDPDRIRTEKDIENESGGPGVYSLPMWSTSFVFFFLYPF